MKPSSLSILISEEASIKGHVYIARSTRRIDEGSPSTILSIFFCEATSHLEKKRRL